MVEDIKNLEKAMKNKNYQISIESKNNFKARRSIYVSRKVKIGEKLHLKTLR